MFYLLEFYIFGFVVVVVVVVGGGGGGVGGVRN